ncbi:MAG: hypothetical protein IKB25_14345, partial [Lentisphaeria bacterium]|nr:hypothetical protein [Lentisphaeria bacterium]
LPKRKIFISFEKSVGNNQKCLRTLSTLRFLRTKMCFQISGFATAPSLNPYENVLSNFRFCNSPIFKVETAEGFTNLYGEQRFLKK